MFELSKQLLNKKLELFTLDDIFDLQKIINYHSDLYYNKQKPIISDFEYDELFKKLEFLENKFWIKDKTTLWVWAELIESTFEKVKHSRPMISLDNTYDEEDLADFDKRVKRLISSENWMLNGLNDIKKAKSKKDYDECFEFFSNIWIKEFELDLTWRKSKFDDSLIFYIKKDSKIVSAIQIERFEKTYIKKEKLGNIVNDWDFCFWRIATLSSYRWKWFASRLINFSIDFLKNKWEKVVFIPSAVENIAYYSKFWFSKFWDKKVCWNTEKVFMKLDLIDKLDYIIEFKFDGVGIEIIYKNGKFNKAITRWNGIEGEDVTENVRQINSIPKTIAYKWNFEIRWEIVMPISSFDKLNQQNKKSGNKVFSNPRNAASGSIRMIDNRVTKQRNLDFYGYDLANNYEFAKENNIDSYYELIKKIDSLWFKTSSYFEKCIWINEVIEKIKNIWNIKKSLDFEIDGLVIKLNDINLWHEVWTTEHHPRYAISYKFPAEVLTTKVLGVEHSIWRTWTITPVANLEPVNVWGVVVRRATLHNYDEIKSLWVKIWDSVFIKRAWEVIPKVISVIIDVRDGSEKGIRAPKKCPSCREKLFKDEDKVRYYCANYSACSSQIRERLIFAVWKQGFNIDWLGKKQVELFLEIWIISDLVSIFNIKDRAEEIMKLEWFQEKSVNNLIKSIESSKNINISSFLNALWIAWVWNKTAKILSRLISSWDNHIFRWEWSVEELEKLYDIWGETAKNIVDFFDDKNNRELVSNLIGILDIKYSSPVSSSLDKNAFFFSKKVCITWSFDGYKRDDLLKLLEESGGEFVSSVSKKTDFLLAWEKAGSKLEKANKLGVKILSLEDFLGKLEIES